MSMWQLVERVERFIIFNVMHEVMIIMVKFIWRQMEKQGYKHKGEWIGLMESQSFILQTHI